jgi:hypothetical protein
MRILKQILGKPIQFGGNEHSGWLPPNATLPQPTPIENAILDIRILETKGGFILEWESRNTNLSNDTWHKTIDDAENQAEYQFGIKPSEWEVLG